MGLPPNGSRPLGSTAASALAGPVVRMILGILGVAMLCYVWLTPGDQSAVAFFSGIMIGRMISIWAYQHLRRN